MPTKREADSSRRSFQLRLPSQVHKALTDIAERERRTLNAQITYALERWLEANAKHH